MEDPGLLSAFLDNLVSRLFSLAEEKYKLYKGFEKDLAFMKSELKMITSAIDGQLLGQDDHILRLSVEELRQVAHEMEDCIDHIMYDASWEQQQPWYCKMVKTGKKRKSRSQLGEEMQQLRCKLEEALQRQQRYSVSCPSTFQPAESSLNQHILPANLVGIKPPLEELLEQLAEIEGQPKQLKVILIVGFCGLGKTILARELYNSMIGKQFNERAWVSAVHGDSSKLLVEILKELHKPPPDTSDVYQLSTDLRNILNNKRYFIVIDDMRSDQWSTIKSAFPRDVSSRILVTTKIKSVANTCSSTNGYIHKMRRLDEKHSKQLFRKEACPGGLSEYMGPDLAAILKKCDGQPLALTTVGQFMRKKSWPTGHDCEDVCNHVRFYHLQSGDDTLDRMHQVLIHDYTSLPSHALRACFLYFAMFPSYHPVRAKRLKRQWLAEGFVRPTNLCTDLAAENFEKLLDQNIIEPIDVSNNTIVKTCKTYGMMHEYITLKSLYENFITLFDGGEIQPKNARRVSLRHNTITDGAILNIDLSLVRSLIVFGDAGKTMLNFDKYQLLRVLDLEDCTDLQNDHLTEICNLLLLKYLSLGGNVTILPKEIKQLKLLETLNLRRTNVKILPTEVIQLPHIIHLFGKFKLPDKAINDELQKFLTSAKCKLQTLAGFLVDESDGFTELMGHMKKLRKVKIWCESTATSSKLTTLQKAIQKFIHDDKDASNDPRSLSLHLDGCSEDFLKELKAPCYLRSLKLQGRLLELPGFVMALRRLRELCLQSTKLTADLLSALTNLKHLQYLKLIADELEEITIKNKALPRLLCLCFVLQHPTFPNIEEGALPFLESLQLLCKDMDGLSGIQIKGFTRLREVTLDISVTNGTKVNWVRVAKEHPNKPKVLLLKRAVPTEVYLGGASASFGTTENGFVLEQLEESTRATELLGSTSSQVAVSGDGPSVDTCLEQVQSGQPPHDGSAEMGRELGGPPPSAGPSDAVPAIKCFRDAAGLGLVESGKHAAADSLTNAPGSQAATATNLQMPVGSPAAPPNVVAAAASPRPLKVYSQQRRRVRTPTSPLEDGQQPSVSSPKLNMMLKPVDMLLPLSVIQKRRKKLPPPGSLPRRSRRVTGVGPCPPEPAVTEAQKRVVLSEGQVQETDTQMPHEEPNSVFISNIGHPVVCAAGLSIAGNGPVAS